jgi:hypothetical protein
VTKHDPDPDPELCMIKKQIFFNSSVWESISSEKRDPDPDLSQQIRSGPNKFLDRSLNGRKGTDSELDQQKFENPSNPPDRLSPVPESGNYILRHIGYRYLPYEY